METVALEWISLLEVEPRDVVQFVQQLNNVPENAVCEVGEIFSRRCRSTGQILENQEERRVRNEVYLSCAPTVTEFLCKKFGKQTQHVTGGEVIRLRCKRVFPRNKPLGLIIGDTKIVSECVGDIDLSSDSTSAAPVLPIDKVIALIDLLGDQVADAQEVYELFADRDARGPQRLTMLGLTKALAQLCKNEWTVRSSNLRSRSDTTTEGKVTVESLRYLLSQLIASNSIAATRLPSATTVPFLSYTDFLACYVAFLARIHCPTLENLNLKLK